MYKGKMNARAFAGALDMPDDLCIYYNQGWTATSAIQPHIIIIEDHLLQKSFHTLRGDEFYNLITI